MSTNRHKPGACPKCGSSEIKPIVYGLVDDEGLEKARRGEVVLGGCEVYEDMPEWECSSCKHRWFDPSDPQRVEREELKRRMSRGPRGV